MSGCRDARDQSELWYVVRLLELDESESSCAERCVNGFRDEPCQSELLYEGQVVANDGSVMSVEQFLSSISHRQACE